MAICGDGFADTPIALSMIVKGDPVGLEVPPLDVVSGLITFGEGASDEIIFDDGFEEL